MDINLKEMALNAYQKDIEKSGKLAKRIASLLDEKKAQKIAIINISEKSSVADYFVICSARSTTAVKALVEYVDEKLSKDKIEPKARDIDTKWCAIDYLGVILHVFYHETREFYNLERLWQTESNTQYIN